MITIFNRKELLVTIESTKEKVRCKNEPAIY